LTGSELDHAQDILSHVPEGRMMKNSVKEKTGKRMLLMRKSFLRQTQQVAAELRQMVEAACAKKRTPV
jgi:hypothetical protein